MIYVVMICGIVVAFIIGYWVGVIAEMIQQERERRGIRRGEG